MTNMLILDGREVWHGPLTEAARARGWDAHRIGLQEYSLAADWGFIRPHPAFLAQYLAADTRMRSNLSMIQDRAQVEVYDDKTEQWRRWGDLMPETHVFHSLDEALEYDGPFPVMSKANEGASSVNVRHIEDKRAYDNHVRKIFGDGIRVNRCADGYKTIQRDYVYVQRFIPHDRTYRVNIVGDRMAIFERFNYADRPMAQTGNTNGVTEFTGLHDSLLEYATAVGKRIQSKWVALDILRDDDEWMLIETSLAWPWTSKDYCDVRFTGGGVWRDLWDVLLQEVENGSFGSICH